MPPNNEERRVADQVDHAILNAKLDQVLEQVTTTNGRVNTLEGWRTKTDQKISQAIAVGATVAIFWSVGIVLLETGLMTWG
jgi:hypothetical protein